MKIINAGYEIIKEPVLTKKIERIARICYKSEEKIGPGTDIKMLENLIKRQHFAMLEHGDVCIEVSGAFFNVLNAIIYKIENNLEVADGLLHIPKKVYLRRTATVLDNDTIRYIVSGNIRAWYECFLEASSIEPLPEELFSIINESVGYAFNTSPITTKGTKYFTYKRITDFSILTDEERMVHETFSVLFTVDRGVTHELVRMRDCSFAQESTRYCNYSLGKFDKEITVIKPCYWIENQDYWTKDEILYNMWKHEMEYAEVCYNNLIEAGATAQQARGVLPHSVKADLVMTTNLREWRHVFELRACDLTGPAHPQVKEVMIPLLKQMRNEYSFAFGDLVSADEVTA